MDPATIRNRILRFCKRLQNEPLLARRMLKISIFSMVLFIVLFLSFRDKPEVVPEAQAQVQRPELPESRVPTTPSKTSLEDDLRQLGMLRNAEDKKNYEDGLRRHAYNALLSERIGSYRELPDTRNELCRRDKDSDKNPDKNPHKNPDKDGDKSSANEWAELSTSVIICFYNEHYETLLRTINTLVKRTPEVLLHEIILVDDHSDNETPTRLKAALESRNEDHAPALSRVRLYRTPERAGLIRARLYGAQYARGRVLFFLDSHCEMNRRWLEPLLERIANDSSVIASPIIDLINPDTFIYTSSPLVKGGFNWGLHFKWDSVPSDRLRTPEDFIRPIPTPTIAGGLFAIERNFFYRLGTYDSGMDIWGGENIEISFRAWMCGGRLEIIPCSRVGHVFRHRRPYGSPEGTDSLAYNSLRVAHVWMDEYRKYYLDSRSDLRSMHYGDVSQRIALRKQLNCSSFKWYLENVYPEMLTPGREAAKRKEASAAKKLDLFDRKRAKTLRKFAIRLAETELCLESASEISYKDAKLSLQTCSRAARRQQWKLTEVSDLRLGPKVCLDTVPGKDRVALGKCHEMGGTQEWSFTGSGNETTTGSTLYNVGSGTCLTVKSPLPALALRRNANELFEESMPSLELVMSFCNTSGEEGNEEEDFYLFNKWTFVPV